MKIKYIPSILKNRLKGDDDSPYESIIGPERTYYEIIQERLSYSSNLVLEEHSPEYIDLTIKNYLKSASVIEQNKSFEEINKETDSNIQSDYIFIIIIISSLFILTLVLHRNNTFSHTRIKNLIHICPNIS